MFSIDQEFVHQGTNNFTLLLSIVFFPVLAVIAVHDILFSPVFGLQ